MVITQVPNIILTLKNSKDVVLWELAKDVKGVSGIMT